MNRDLYELLNNGMKSWKCFSFLLLTLMSKRNMFDFHLKLLIRPTLFLSIAFYHASSNKKSTDPHPPPSHRPSSRPIGILRKSHVAGDVSMLKRELGLTQARIRVPFNDSCLCLSSANGA